MKQLSKDSVSFVSKEQSHTPTLTEEDITLAHDVRPTGNPSVQVGAGGKCSGAEQKSRAAKRVPPMAVSDAHQPFATAI